MVGWSVLLAVLGRNPVPVPGPGCFSVSFSRPGCPTSVILGDFSNFSASPSSSSLSPPYMYQNRFLLLIAENPFPEIKETWYERVRVCVSMCVWVCKTHWGELTQLLQWQVLDRRRQSCFLFVVPILPRGWHGWCSTTCGLSVIGVESEGQILLPGTGSLGSRKQQSGRDAKENRRPWGTQSQGWGASTVLWFSFSFCRGGTWPESFRNLPWLTQRILNLSLPWGCPPRKKRWKLR